MKKILSFVVVLAAATMVGCCGNATKKAAAEAEAAPVATEAAAHCNEKSDNCNNDCGACDSSAACCAEQAQSETEVK